MIFLDANVLLRFLTKQPPEQATAALDLLARGETGELDLVVSPVVIAEVVYVLSGVYVYDFERIEAELLALLATGAFTCEHDDAVIDALARTRAKSDFADAYLAARARLSGGAVASFDKGFGTLDVEWLEPPT